MRRAYKCLGLVLVMSLVLAACGGDGDSEEQEAKSMRFVFAPDPVWNWLVDEGILEEMEEEAGITIERNESEDEFAFFAGGHADIVSTGSYETPVLEAESGVETVTIGKYNKAKDIIVVAPDSGYATFGDLEAGCPVGVESFGGSTIVWIALAGQLHDRVLGQTDEDLQMAITDFNTAPELVLSGDLCAGVTSIYNTLPYLVDDQVDGLYEYQSASQIYGEAFVPGHEGMNSNNFVVTKSWYDDHPDEVAFFLSVWDRGVQEWQENRDEILAAYPEDFGFNNDAELNYLKDWYQTEFDEFVDTVYLDEDWIQGELEVTQLLIDTGVIPAGSNPPLHACIDPDSGEETCLLPS